jgi:hypothetical protein
LIWGAVAVRFSTPSMSRNRRGTSRASFPEELDKDAMGTRRRARKAPPSRPGVLARALLGVGNERTATNEPRVTAATHIAPREVRASGGGRRDTNSFVLGVYSFEFAGLKSATHTCTKPDYGTKPGASFVAHLTERAAPDALPTGAAGHSRTRRDLRVRPPRSGARIPETGASRSPRPLTDRRFSETPPWSWPTRTTRRGSDA